MTQVERIIAYLQVYIQNLDLERTTLDIETLLDRIRLFCNNSTVSESLERIIAQELYLIYDRGDMKGLKEIKQGDTTYSFATPKDLDRAIINMKLALVPFRRVGV